MTLTGKHALTIAVGMRVQRPRRGAVRECNSPEGLLLLDAGMRPLYANEEAMHIASYPEESGTLHNLRDFVREKVPFLSPGRAAVPGTPSTRTFLSGRRHYLCRIFELEHDSKNPTAPALAVLLERSHAIAADVKQAAGEFHLTDRERQTVKLLFEDLTTKEIAARMGISPNTVKVFLHLVMVKMKVTTRSGIAGKILELIQDRRTEPGMRLRKGPESDPLRRGQERESCPEKTMD